MAKNPITSPLSDADRDAVGPVLQATLVDLVDLSLIGKQAHWNVIGKNFRSVHLQLDELVVLARNAADQVAERAALSASRRTARRRPSPSRPAFSYPHAHARSRLTGRRAGFRGAADRRRGPGPCRRSRCHGGLLTTLPVQPSVSGSLLPDSDPTSALGAVTLLYGALWSRW